MYPFISVLVIIVSILLILIVLVQNSKGGGLASNFSSSNQMMGVRKTTDFLEKATWTLAGALLVLSFVAVMVIRPTQQAANGLEEQLNSKPNQTELPAFDVPQSNDAQPANTTTQEPQEPQKTDE